MKMMDIAELEHQQYLEGEAGENPFELEKDDYGDDFGDDRDRWSDSSRRYDGQYSGRLWWRRRRRLTFCLFIIG